MWVSHGEFNENNLNKLIFEYFLNPAQSIRRRLPFFVIIWPFNGKTLIKYSIFLFMKICWLNGFIYLQMLGFPEFYFYFLLFFMFFFFFGNNEWTKNKKTSENRSIFILVFLLLFIQNLKFYLLFPFCLKCIFIQRRTSLWA